MRVHKKYAKQIEETNDKENMKSKSADDAK